MSVVMYNYRNIIILSGGANSAWNPIWLTISQKCAGMSWNIFRVLEQDSCFFLSSNSSFSEEFSTFST